MDTKWNGTAPDSGTELQYFVASQVRESVEMPDKSAPGAAAGKPLQRVKAATGFLSFFLGITLTLGSLGAITERLAMQRGALPDWSGDWQDTQEFRDEVSSYLLEFLSLGASGTTGNAWYHTAVDTGGWRQPYTEVVVSDVLDVSEEARPGEAASGDYEAQAESSYREGDKNVLYFIMEDDRIRYKNITANSAQQFQNRSFEGYNFYLTYESGKAVIVKDGVELNIYGDGVYVSGQSPWFIPGYENLQAGDWLDGVTVYMAVREEPVRYWFQSGSGEQYFYGRMYNVARRAEEARSFYLRQSALLSASVLCLGLWFLLRREKRLADAKIAAWTGHVWTEIWVLLALVPLGWLFVTRSWGELYWACREMWWSYEFLPWEQLAYGLLRFVFSGFPVLLALGWVLWLAWNNRRYNPREKRKSLLRNLFRGLRKLLRSLRMKDLERPVEKRLARTVASGTAALAVVLTGLIFFLAALLPDLRWYGAKWRLLTLGLTLAALAVLVLLVLSARSLRLGRDLGRLHRQIEAIRSGDLATPLDLPEDADLRKTAEALNDIQAGMRTALAEQTRSERMKVELISNVSHDLKTPLTSILSYAELLRGEDLPPAAADYARVIDEKARRLKTMVQDVFEVSKAAADQLPVSIERLDLAKLLRQTLADLDDPVKKSGLIFKVDLPEEPVMIQADGKRLYRVFQNLIDNALRYALPGSRVYLALKTVAGQAETSVRNISRDELPEGVDFTARFVRGDESRSDGGSGLGLSIASSFTEACGGTFRAETMADLFTAVVTFPLAKEEVDQ